MATRKNILESAMKCVNGDRDEQYGKPEDSFLIISKFWTAYLNRPGVIIEKKDVAAMLGLMKIARISTGAQKTDNWIDLAGYAACGGECESQDSDVSKCEGCEFHTDEILPADFIYGCTLRRCMKKKVEVGA